MMPRRKVTIPDLVNQTKQDAIDKTMAPLPRNFFEYRPNLYRNLAMPSYVHGYSLAIQYMRQWFLDRFPENYFKTVHVNGKHVLDDWKHFNNLNIKREKPMVAIVPTVEFDYDREQLDLYVGDQDMFLKRSNYQQSFFKDYKNDAFLAMQMRALRMNFGFKVRVNSRAQQLDLFNRMEIWFRIGATQQDNISADFHIPYNIMLNLAKDVGFDIDTKTNMIKNISGFISYLNSHSDLPFIFKLRAINQKPEFFVRVRDLYVHIACKDKLQMDDGERDGKLDTNFHIEMQATLTIPIPHFYVYFSQDPIVYNIEVKETNSEAIGIYSINVHEIPPENEIGWGQFAQTSYLTEIGEQTIDISEIFNCNKTVNEVEGNIGEVVKHSIELGISPYQFIDVEVYYTNDVALKVPFTMDHEHLTILLDAPMAEERMIDIAIYADKKYINDNIIALHCMKDSRITSDKLD